MKIGIVTFVDYNNYGNRLQNYAMQEFLREKGFQTETILIEMYNDYHFTDEYKRKLPVHWVKSVIKSVYGLIMQKSFIQNVLDDPLVRRRKKGNIINMKGIKCISVREKSAQKLIKELTGRNSVVLLDPTMLVKRKVWDNLITSRKFKYEDKKYMVVYILGDLSGSEEKYLRKAARISDMEIIWLNDRRYKKEFVLDAIDFVQIIARAGMVVTDSYHACIFSILYYRQFYVFQRQGTYSDIYSRIQDLLDNFGLQEHAVLSMEDLYHRICTEEKIWDIENKSENKKIMEIHKVYFSKACSDHAESVKSIYYSAASSYGVRFGWNGW